MITLIEKVIITRALDEQQKNLFDIISSNLEIAKQQIANQRIKTNHRSYTLKF